jgi:hypothetical protein
MTTEEEADFTADYKEGIFTLKNVKIDFTDAQGYETSISTDLVFHTPVMNFDGTSERKSFMSYSLIADNAITINCAGVTVGGNVYAGTGGINTVSPAVAVLNGDRVVTRGDISVDSGTNLTIGGGSTQLWAENIQTTGENGAASSLTINGDCYVEDDLVLNGKSSTVTLLGKYYGYNFQKDYLSAASSLENNAEFSSAMMINARDSRLDLSGLSYLLLAGRTYISRGSAGNTQNTDIMTGESVSVRTNQLAYYVPVKYLNVDDAAHVVFADGKAAEYETAIGVSDIMSYLDTANPIVTYYFRDNSVTSQRYYLRFASEQKANDFFADYFAANSDTVSNYAKEYAGENAIILNDSMLYTLKGDVMYQTAVGAEVREQKITIDASDWEQDGLYYNYADRLAVMYRSLQTYLEESDSTITSANVRFENASGEIDKTIDPLFDNIVDVDALKAAVPSTTVDETKVSLTATTNQLTAIVNNEGSSAYEIPLDCVQGVVIATGDVCVDGSFTGLVLCGGTITFKTGASVDSDEVLVSQLFETDAALGSSAKFTPYFRNYGSISSSAVGLVQIDHYLTYENWTKNEQ